MVLRWPQGQGLPSWCPSPTEGFVEEPSHGLWLLQPFSGDPWGRGWALPVVNAKVSGGSVMRPLVPTALPWWPRGPHWRSSSTQGLGEDPRCGQRLLWPFCGGRGDVVWPQRCPLLWGTPAGKRPRDWGQQWPQRGGLMRWPTATQPFFGGHGDVGWPFWCPPSLLRLRKCP